MNSCYIGLLLYCCCSMKCQTNTEYHQAVSSISELYSNENLTTNIYDFLMSSNLHQQAENMSSILQSMPMDRKISPGNNISYSNIDLDDTSAVDSVNYTKTIVLPSINMSSTVHENDMSFTLSSEVNSSNFSVQHTVGLRYEIAGSFEEYSTPYKIEHFPLFPKSQIHRNSSSSFDIKFMNDNIHNDVLHSITKEGLFSDFFSNTSVNIQSTETISSSILQNLIAYSQNFKLKDSIVSAPYSPEVTNLTSMLTEDGNMNQTKSTDDSCTFNLAKPLKHEFVIVFNFTSKGKEDLLHLLRSFFNDTYCYIKMTAFIAGTPTIFSWINASLGSNQCTNSEIERNWLSMVGKDGHLKKDFVDWFHPSSAIYEVQKRYLAPCIEKKYSPKENTILIALTLSFLVLIFLLSIYKRRKFFMCNASKNNTFNEAFSLKNRMPTILMMERN